MTDIPITYHEHYNNQAALSRIESFCESCPEVCHDDCRVLTLKKETKSRTYQNIKPVLELSLDEITDQTEPTLHEHLVSLEEDTEI